jgi:hypothetical protein
VALKAEDRIIRYTTRQLKFFRNLARSWANDGLDHPSRSRSLKDFLRVNFDPDLLNWDRKVAEAMLTRHLNLPSLWETTLKDEAEVFEAQLRSMPVCEDPYAYLDYEPDELDCGLQVGSILDLVPLGYWSQATVIRQRHDSMEAPQGLVSLKRSGPLYRATP